MAKGGKSGKSDAESSLLDAAFSALERGDVVVGRKLAKAALEGKAKGDEAAAAKRLSKALSAEGAPVGDTVQDVANALLLKSAVSPKPFVFAAVAITIWLLLLLLYNLRYAGT